MFCICIAYNFELRNNNKLTRYLDQYLVIQKKKHRKKSRLKIKKKKILIKKIYIKYTIISLKLDK